MSALTRLGVSAYQAPAGGASFIVGTTHEFAGGVENFAFNTSGAAAGDLLVAYTINNTPAVTLTLHGSGNAITSLDERSDSVFVNALYARTLTSGDISDGTIDTNSVPDTGGYVVQIAIYRGATTATFKAFQTAASSSTLVFSGFAPSGSSLGVVFMGTARNSSANAISGSPGTWVARVNPGAGPVGYFQTHVLDELTGYTNATTTFSGWASAAPDVNDGYLLELT